MIFRSLILPVFSSPDFLKIYVGAINTHVVELTDTEVYLKEKGNHFSESEALEIALREMQEKSQIIRESGISVQVKRSTFRYIEQLLAGNKMPYLTQSSDSTKGRGGIFYEKISKNGIGLFYGVFCVYSMRYRFSCRRYA